eukprot:s3902_g4.t1
MLKTACFMFILFGADMLLFWTCCTRARHFHENKAEGKLQTVQSDRRDQPGTESQKWTKAFWPNDTLENWADRINDPKHLMPIRPSNNFNWSDSDGIKSQAGHTVSSDRRDSSGTELQKWTETFWPNDRLENWADRINGPKHLMPMRPSNNFNWSDSDGIISQAGHTVCSFIRDGWSCSGSEYAKVLRATHPYQHTPANYNLLGLPPTKILAVGNSLLAELVGAVICNHKWTAVFVLPDRIANSLLAHNAEKNITIVLLSNDGYTDGSRDPRSTATLAQEAKFRPDVILLGSYNNRKNGWAQAYENPYRQTAQSRRTYLVEAFPKAIIVDLPGKHVGDSCPSHRCYCRGPCAKKRAKVLASKQDFFTQHECIPGPILRYAEELVSVLHTARLAHDKNISRSCLGVGRPRPVASGCG